jgi:hypothetical protein
MVQNKPTPHKYRPERYKTNPHHTNTVLKKSVSSTMWDPRLGKPPHHDTPCGLPMHGMHGGVWNTDDVLKHQGHPRRLRGGLASFKGVFVSEHLSFVSYHHADFSYPWHLFHTQMSFFHTCCNIFIPFWYISKRMVCNLSGSVPP